MLIPGGLPDDTVLPNPLMQWAGTLGDVLVIKVATRAGWWKATSEPFHDVNWRRRRVFVSDVMAVVAVGEMEKVSDGNQMRVELWNLFRVESFPARYTLWKLQGAEKSFRCYQVTGNLWKFMKYLTCSNEQRSELWQASFEKRWVFTLCRESTWKFMLTFGRRKKISKHHRVSAPKALDKTPSQALANVS